MPAAPLACGLVPEKSGRAAIVLLVLAGCAFSFRSVARIAARWRDRRIASRQAAHRVL